MKILITGSKGQLGTELLKQMNTIKNEENLDIFTPTKEELNLLNLQKCEDYVKDLKPDILINLAAYTAVEKAENDIRNARTINGLALKSFANGIKYYGGYIIQISTDYVFNGEQNFPYRTSDPKDPLGVYGKTKYEGEKFIENILRDTNQYTIIRTSWLVGPWGENFVKTILKKLKNKKDQKCIKVVSDQIGCITTTESLSKIILTLVDKKSNNENIPNQLHWCSSGKASWYQIALSIKKISKEINFINSDISLEPISSREYKSLCPRPKYSLLNNKETEELLDIKSNHWEKDLEDLIKKIQKNNIL